MCLVYKHNPRLNTVLEASKDTRQIYTDRVTGYQRSQPYSSPGTAYLQT